MRINLMMALCVMRLDVRKLCRVAERGHVPVQSAQPGVDGRVAGADVAEIAFLMGTRGILAWYYM